MAAETDIEYRGLIAESWDLFRPNAPHWPDVAFYRDLIREGGAPALDVGCASGRLVLQYLSDGIDSVAVDLSRDRLAVVQRKAEERGLRPGLYQQTMEALALPRRYGTIVVSSSTFQLLTNPVDAREALRRFHAHLTPGGLIVMSLMLLYKGSDPGPIVREEWGEWQERARPDGATVRRRSRSTYDLAAQLESSESVYELLRDGEVVVREAQTRAPATRWYTQDQSVALLKDAGFTDVRLTHEFTHEPARPDDTLWCAIARKPAT
jgi:2-polyprenyl-3-methyl-5-hydroxy-6-metoxy-1,4-benzoquinol methylase